MQEKNELRRRFCLLFSLVLTALLCWRWQRIFYLMCADYILSDVPNHVKLALGHNDYSLASWIVRALWAALGESRGQTALSLVLTTNQLLGVLAVWALLRELFPELEKSGAYLAALLAHVCASWVLPVPDQMQMYLGAYSGNVLHNMTMLFSRTPLPLALLFFFRLWDARSGKLNMRDWLGFLLTLLLSTLFKPSFLGAFAPAAFVLLVIDFVRTRCRGFKNEFLIGLAVIPSLLVLLWSSSVLYAEDFAGPSSGVTLRVLSLSAFAALLLRYLRGLLLPLWGLSARGELDRTRRGRLQILDWVLAVSILEAMFLAETGFRANDGNFEWGSLALYPTVFAAAIALLLLLWQRPEKDRPTRVRAILGTVLLLGHLLTGAWCLHVPGHVGGYHWFYF